MEEQRPTPARRAVPWQLILFGALALYAVIIVLLNLDEVKINFLFFSGEISKLVLIVLCLGIGFAAGFLFDHWRERRRSQG